MPKKGGFRRSPCPHCKKVTLTVDGVCAQCWGMKSNRPFPWRRGQLQQDGDFIDDIIRRETHDGGDLIDDLILWGCCWWPAFASVATLTALMIILIQWT